VQQYPEADAQLKQLLQVLGDIEDVARHIPAAIVNAAEESGPSYCKGIHGKPIFSALYDTYKVTLQELKAAIKARTLAGQTNLPKQQGNKQRRRMVPRSTEAEGVRHRPSHRNFKESDSADRLKHPPKEVVIRNFFAPSQDSGHGHRRFRY
jgi:hypothetical protein